MRVKQYRVTQNNRETARMNEIDSIHRLMISIRPMHSHSVQESTSKTRSQTLVRRLFHFDPRQKTVHSFQKTKQQKNFKKISKTKTRNKTTKETDINEFVPGTHCANQFLLRSQSGY